MNPVVSIYYMIYPPLICFVFSFGFLLEYYKTNLRPHVFHANTFFT